MKTLFQSRSATLLAAVSFVLLPAADGLLADDANVRVVIITGSGVSVSRPVRYYSTRSSASWHTYRPAWGLPVPVYHSPAVVYRPVVIRPVVRPPVVYLPIVRRLSRPAAYRPVHYRPFRSLSHHTRPWRRRSGGLSISFGW